MYHIIFYCYHIEFFNWRVDNLDGRNTNCSCEGACGCAISCSNLQDLPVGNLSTLVTSVVDREILESEYNQKAIVSSSARKINEHREEDFSKSAIVKLLSSKLKLPYHSANLTAIPSLCDTLHCSFENPSRDSCVRKISTISTCNSCDKLQDNFEIVSEAVSNVECTNPRTMANTSSDTPKSIIGLGHHSDRQHFSYNLDNLYEGIKILDSYLTCRNPNVGHEHRQSVTVILFGTPKHESTCNLIASSQQTRRERYMRARTWRSSEDASSN